MTALSAATICAGSVDAAGMSAKDKAYTLTLMCAAFASAYGTDADGLRTQDAVRKMGRAKGYSSKRVSGDAIDAASVVGVEIRNDPSLIERNRVICRALKLMD